MIEVRYFASLREELEIGSETMDATPDMSSLIEMLRSRGGVWEEVGTASASDGGISDNDGKSRNPSVAVTPDGTPYVVWYDQSSGDNEIYVRRWYFGVPISLVGRCERSRKAACR